MSSCLQVLEGKNTGSELRIVSCGERDHMGDIEHSKGFVFYLFFGKE